MLALPDDLDRQCYALFGRCAEFDSAQALRALFVTSDLAPFANSLPARQSDKRAFVDAVKLFLLTTYLADGRVLLLPFLAALRGRYVEQDALHGELNDLYEQVLAYVQPAPPLPPPSALNHLYLCYAPRDGLPHAQRLHSALQAVGEQPWLDQIDTPAGHDAEAAVEEALRECAAVLLVLTAGSANVQGESAREWRRALRFKKPIIPVRFRPGVALPLLLAGRTVLDFSGSFELALDNLRRHVADLTSPAGMLRELEYRLADAERELRSAAPDQRPRILQDITQLDQAISDQRTVARDPQAAARSAEARTAAALERERQPDQPTGGRRQTKFINPPPLVAPSYFQDRHVENRLIGDFLRDPARRLLTVVGRGGVGKTALVCRLLKALEAGHLPDDLGALPVGGIVYLSAIGSHRVSFPNLYGDLLRLLPAERAQPLTARYQDPHLSVAAKMTPLCEALAEVMQHPVVLLLDNLEDLIDPATHTLTDTEVDAALRALLAAPPHPLKVLLTSRIAPRELLLLQPERQMTVPLDAGLPSPFAEEVLRAGDPSGVLGLQNAPDEELAPAREYTRGFPRALEALTAALNADRATTLAELLAGAPPANVVEALVGQAYSRLDASAQKVLQGLAVFGRPVPAAAVDYLLQPALPGLDSTPVLNRLVNMRFVSKEAGRYYMHPVDRAYALQRPNLQSPVATLQSRAADYFRATRTPRTAWKNLDDLAPQLAEIDLRYAAGDYNSAADVLTDIDYDYLLLWGHYRLLIDQHERLQGKLSDAQLKRLSVGSLGGAYWHIGQNTKAIACYEQALVLSRETGNRSAEGVYLTSLGLAYSDRGEVWRAINYCEQALAISREIGYRYGEVVDLVNLGISYSKLGEVLMAIGFYEQALAISREIENKYAEGCSLAYLAQALIDRNHYQDAVQQGQESAGIGAEISSIEVGSEGNYALALAHFYADNLSAARAAVEQARQYDYPPENHNVLALLGLIALRQNDLPAAHEAFSAARSHAESLLAHTPEYLSALDAKALALAGLGEIAAARAAYQAARAINRDPGIVQHATRLLAQVAGIPQFWVERGIRDTE